MDKKELDNLQDLKVYSESAGGKFLVDSARSACLNLVEQLSNGFADLTEIQLREKCARLNANLSMYQLLTGIPEQIEAIKKLFENKE